MDSLAQAGQVRVSPKTELWRPGTEFDCVGSMEPGLRVFHIVSHYKQAIVLEKKEQREINIRMRGE